VPFEGTNQLDDGNIPVSTASRTYKNSCTRKAEPAMTDSTRKGSNTPITKAWLSFVLSIVDFSISVFPFNPACEY